MRTWELDSKLSTQYETPMQASIQKRGMCLMIVEFLTRFPAAECIVTSNFMPFMNDIYDMFPKTFFQVFCSQLDHDPRPNVLRHPVNFDADQAARYGKRGVPYNLIFTIEDINSQTVLYMNSFPVASLLFLNGHLDPHGTYLQGELVFPLYCSPGSSFCALIPSPGQAKLRSYKGFYSAMSDFQNRMRFPGSSYDTVTEDLILRTHARNIACLVDGPTALLHVEITRKMLPPLESSDIILWEPSVHSPRGVETELDAFAQIQSNLTRCEIQDLLFATLQVLSQ